MPVITGVPTASPVSAAASAALLGMLWLAPGMPVHAILLALRPMVFAEGLARAQANAEARRKAIGASRSAAATMVSDASRARRRAEMFGAARATEGSV